jgi:hypothetical protein
MQITILGLVLVPLSLIWAMKPVRLLQRAFGDSALYFANERKQTMIDAVERLLDEPGLADTLRTRGRARSAALSWDVSAHRLGDAVQRVR